jgi:exodeoxyribonuclease VII small subunit
VPTPSPDSPDRPAATRATLPSASSADVSVETLGYEQARDELVAVVARLEAGAETLEGSLQLWERGEALAARCQEWLDGARERLDAARTTAPSTAREASTGARTAPGRDDDKDER